MLAGSLRVDTQLLAPVSLRSLGIDTDSECPKGDLLAARLDLTRATDRRSLSWGLAVGLSWIYRRVIVT